MLTNLFLAALLAVEGAHQHDANRYQLTPAFVRESNRRNPTAHYTLADRRDPVRAHRMVTDWLADLRRRHPAYSPARIAACFTSGERGARIGRGRCHGERVSTLYRASLRPKMTRGGPALRQPARP
jgi:hypothetical protein